VFTYKTCAKRQSIIYLNIIIDIKNCEIYLANVKCWFQPQSITAIALLQYLMAGKD